MALLSKSDFKVASDCITKLYYKKPDTHQRMMKMITKIGGQKLFGKKDNEQEDEGEIQYRKKNSKFLYVQMTGDLENYNISLAKKPK